MKNTLLILLSAILFISCDRGLPSYEQVHGKPDTEENKDDDKPGTQEPVPEAPELGYEVLPSGEGAYIDGELILSFKSAPVPGKEGKIRIFKSDGTEVDMIDMADVAAGNAQMVNDTPFNTTIDLLGPKSLKRWRAVYYKPVEVSGNSVIIRPHSNVLEYDSTYYITIDASSFSADGFEGIDAREWSFKTKSKPASTSEVTAARSGKSDFRTIQGAIDWAYVCGPDNPMTINIRNGIYQEQLFARQNNKITLKGESRDGVILQYANSEAFANGVGGSTATTRQNGTAIGRSGGRAVILLENCDDIRFEDMTLKNTYGKPGQAEVIYNNDNNGQYNIAFVNCSLHSLQDTFNTKGYAWLYDCLIEGDCDYIWGSAKICLFEKCEIRSAGDGYIVQARCPSAEDKGFVFLDCDLTRLENVSDNIMYLARSGGSADYYDNVAYINCRMSDVIRKSGWESSKTPNPAKASASSGWKEYGSMDSAGAPLSLAGRYSGAYELTDAEHEAGYMDRYRIFDGASVGTDWLKE